VASVEIKGLKKLVKGLKQFDTDLSDELKTVHKAAAEDVASTARGGVPTRSGRLKGSIRTGVTAKTGIVRSGKSAVPYAGPIHFGWKKRNIKPQPFLYDALDKRRSDVVKRYLDAVTKIADKVGD
jgi:hypothetical protein